MRVGLIPTLRDSFSLFRQHFIILYLEFLAVTIAGLTLFALLFPTRFMESFTEESANLADQIISPHMIMASALNALVTAMVVLRIWNTHYGSISAQSAFRANLGPLLVLSLFVDLITSLSAVFLLFPAFLIQAIATVYIPAMMIEGQGWNALRRSYLMVRGNILGLTGIWALVLLPWIALLIFFQFRGQTVEIDTPFTAWRHAITSDLFSPVFSAFGACLIIAVYKRLLDIESGGTRKDLDNTFR